jgi:hypothetical protein
MPDRGSTQAVVSQQSRLENQCVLIPYTTSTGLYENINEMARDTGCSPRPIIAPPQYLSIDVCSWDGRSGYRSLPGSWTKHDNVMASSLSVYPRTVGGSLAREWEKKKMRSFTGYRLWSRYHSSLKSVPDLRRV